MPFGGDRKHKCSTLIQKQMKSTNDQIKHSTATDGKPLVSGSFYWATQYYHPDNNFTMDDFLSNHLPEEAIVHHIEGTYAEVEYEGRDYGLHAGGNGDSFNHVIRWELL